MQELQRSKTQVTVKQNLSIMLLISTHNIETLKPSDRSPIVRIQYYQKPFKSIGMVMTTRLLI